MKGVFNRAIEERRDVTSTFFGDFGFDLARSKLMIESDIILRAKLRNRMNASGKLFILKNQANAFYDKAKQLLDFGRVGAVDGTTALSKIDFNNTTQYACAVGWITTRTRDDPHIIITETSSAYANPQSINAASGDDLNSICEQLDESRDNNDWPTSFMLWEERRVAIENCDADIIFIDGPLFPERLVTQEKGRDLLQKLIGSPKTYIGIIKNLSVSWAMCRWCASALEPGEGFIIGPIADHMMTTLAANSKEQAHLTWIPNTSNFVRIVFRPNDKSFAFECHEQSVGLACAILELNSSPTIYHELPILIETIDSQLRAGFNGGMAAQMVINSTMRQADGYRCAVDASDERDFR